MVARDLPSVQPLFHLGYVLPLDSSFIKATFSQTSYLLLCGTASRAYKLAQAFSNGPHVDHCRTDRYVLLQPHPSIVIAAHGIGLGSVDTLLHEVHQLLKTADVKEYAMIRVGSCGGVGVPAGSVIVTRRALNASFEPCLEVHSVGEVLKFPARLDSRLSKQLEHKGNELYPGNIVGGDTLCASTFYIAQGRLDGAFANGDEAALMHKLKLCRDKGVVNFEMESLAVAAFAAKVGVSAAVVCAALVDRMRGETPVESKDVLDQWQERAVHVVVEFVKEEVGL